MIMLQKDITVTMMWEADPMHGSHVAGIIGADRTNTIGIKGIADNVRILAVRCVPDGDERIRTWATAFVML